MFPSYYGNWRFQSTLPARGATPYIPVSKCTYLDFNPRSPHGERPRQRVTPPNAKGISIHAPRTGSDLHHAANVDGVRAFQSTLPARGATRALREKNMTI